MGKWRKVKTMPTDGRMVLMAFKNGDICLAPAITLEPIAVDKEFDPGWMITHWHPLPDHPKKKNPDRQWRPKVR